MNKYFVFNPDHEIALASRDIHFKPKQNIEKIANDLSILPLWIEGDSLVEKSCINPEWLLMAKTLGLQPRIVDRVNPQDVSEIKVWGWNQSLCYTLSKEGFAKSLLPTPERLSAISLLTERKTAWEAMKWLRERLPDADFPIAPRLVSSTDEILEFLQQYDEITLKSPLSESGKGVYFAKEIESHSIRGWIERTLRKQNYLVCEPRYDVVKNFAMEFECGDDGVDFLGYSLFETNGKSYLRNLLMLDDDIERILTQYISYDILDRLKSLLLEFIVEKISPFYHGYLGVDMFIFDSKTPKLYPCIEINLRPTMGLIAHEFYKNRVSPYSKGSFEVVFFKDPKELLQIHYEWQKSYPLIITDGRVESGYCSLTPILHDTNYIARATINSN